MWSYSSNSSFYSDYPPQQATPLFFSDVPVLSKGSFCLTVLDEKLPVSVTPCDASNPPSQSWHIQQGKGPGMSFTISSVAYPASCIGLDLDSNDNFLSSSLIMQSCDFFDSGLAVSWDVDTQAQPTQLRNSFSKSSCASAIDAANVTAFTYGSGSDSATFVVNRDSNASQLFMWNSAHYAVAASATLILDAGGVVLFDSANVSAAPAKRTYPPPPLNLMQILRIKYRVKQVHARRWA